MSRFRWGLIGPGRIAGTFAQAVAGLPGSCLHAVWARDLAKAQAFAEQWSAPNTEPVRASNELDAFLRDPAVDGVYIATPHAQHGEFIAASLAAGKPVLCEKPLVPNLVQGQALVALAQQRQCFLMEAVWTRFLPLYAQVGEWLRAQRIGTVRAMQSSFCFAIPFEESNRCFAPALAGGALLDIGIYNLTMTRWVMQQALGDCPEPLSIQAQGVLAPSGVDQRLAATLQFPGGVSSQFLCAFDSQAENALHIYGERGRISISAPFWGASEATLVLGDAAPLRVQLPPAINGFEGEIEEAQRCIRAGLIESPHISHADSLATLGWMDEIRRQLGVRYPFE